MKNGHPFALFPDIPHNSDQLSKPSAVEKWGETFFEGAFLTYTDRNDLVKIAIQVT